ncbi:hypothetical protein HYALB_00006061 [Hymenoscyphus albidus]|uniref:G-patch domain-containing protein n=1 Tax=Hymenoscyphus albidus TaxID=595503 RepID=A0A9N9Q1Q0_9HELO|nr:hypothetical protein HYALB_00006061 [Hymenoscyphus albidus]
MPTQDPQTVPPDETEKEQKQEEEEEEEDYMSMIIPEQTLPKRKETYTQRLLRQQREREASQPKPKAERLLHEAAQRDTALSTSLLSSPNAQKNKGLAMMAKMGFKPGVALGSKDNPHARLEPVGISIKEDRGGIGLDAEKKRKFNDEVEREGKRVRAEEGDYRERVRREREVVRLEGQIGAAMRVAESMAGEKEEVEMGVVEVGKKRTISTKPLKSVNILWRGLIRQREEKERDRRMRYDLQQSLSRHVNYDNDDEDAEDKRALGRDVVQHTLVEDLEEEDPELDAFSELDPAERLEKLVVHLRQEHNYCFWCKFTYPNKEFEGCPGLTEEEHD